MKQAIIKILDAIPPWILVIVQSVALYTATGIVKDTFTQIEPLYAAWYRVGFLALAMALWRRPWRKKVKDKLPRDWRMWRTIIVCGVAIAAMNTVFYLAIDNMDMGIAVAIEFLGPLTVAVVSGRNWRERVGIVIATAGVVLLAGISFIDPGKGDFALGFIAILCSAAMWGMYIVAGRGISAAEHSIDLLTVAIIIGFALQSLVLGVPAVKAVISPRAGATWALLPWGRFKLVGLLAFVALLGSFLAYLIDQIVMPKLSSGAFSVMQSINPAVAVMVGLVFGEIPSWAEVGGIGMVIVAVAVTFSGDRYPA